MNYALPMPNKVEIIFCSWCDKEIKYTIFSKQGVCSECFNVLRIAGLSDEEIFRERKLTTDQS
jgi:hypothetical protein